MSTSNSNYVVSVPKLKGRENHAEWVFAAENFLILEGTSECIKRTKSEEDAVDAKTKAKLVLTIDPSLYVHIKRVQNTKQLWDKLKQLFDDLGFTRRISLLRNLISIRLENCSSMTSYVTQVIETSQKLSGTGFKVECVSYKERSTFIRIPKILKCLMGIMIFITFALNFWAPFNLVWHYVSKKHHPKRHWLWERVYRAFFIVVISAIAIGFPNIGNLMGLLGAFCLSNMGFIFPAIIELLVIWDDPGLGKYKWRLWKNILVLLIGVLFFFAGTYSNLKGLITNL